MPYRPKRPCGIPTCKELITSGGYCEKHKKQKQKQTDDNRGTAHERGYTAHHRKLRKMVMAEQPICAECIRQGELSPGVEMHHIDGDVWNTDRDNVEMLCKRHHSQITVREQGGLRGRP